jgi:hypothetical protein
MNRKINWLTIHSDIKEAREELQDVEKRIARGEDIGEADLKVMLQHAHFHINFAWNARHADTERYSQCSSRDFKRWGRYPRTFEEQ